jgi:hypothetical protein
MTAAEVNARLFAWHRWMCLPDPYHQRSRFGDAGRVGLIRDQLCSEGAAKHDVDVWLMEHGYLKDRCDLALWWRKVWQRPPGKFVSYYRNAPWA